MKKLNQNGFTPFEIVLLILVVALLGFAGYVVYQRNQDTTGSSQTVVTKKDTNTEKKTEVKDETAGWLSYTNTSGKFSFKYPNNWVMAANPEFCSDGLLLLGVKMAGDQSSVGRCASDGARAFGQMSISWRNDRADLSQCGLNSESWRTDSKENVTVAGVPAVKTTGTYIADDESTGGGAKGNTAVQYCFVKNRTQYIAGYTKWSDYPDALSDFNTMVTKTFILN